MSSGTIYYVLIDKLCCTSLVLNRIPNQNIVSNTYCVFIQVKSSNPPNISLSTYQGGYGAIISIKRVTVHELNELVENIARVNSKQLDS